MKVCVETHRVASFGEIPEGSLWADDSPYLEDASKFADVPGFAQGGVIREAPLVMLGNGDPERIVPAKPKRTVKKEI